MSEIVNQSLQKTFLQAKTFTKKMLTLPFCKQKALPKNMMKRAMPLKICLPAQQKREKNQRKSVS
ncbi:MAG: hypothetical protein GQ523_00125 [Methanophagales archaeon]|nr:hypothetical protein [Methanophagales archaeon]